MPLNQAVITEFSLASANPVKVLDQTTQLLTVLFVRLVPADPDQHTAPLGRLARIVEQHEGEMAGNEDLDYWALFATGDAALSAAVAAHNALAALPNLTLSVALHTGRVERRAHRVGGEAITLAARIAEAGTPNQIVLSESVSLGLHDESRQLLRPYDRIRLGSQRDEIRLFEAIWRAEDLSQTPIGPGMIDTGYLRNLNWSRLRLSIDGHHIDVRPPMTPLAMGRGHHCEVRVESVGASRDHARIEHQRGKFILVDQSTNGTHLRRADGSEAILRDEACVLTGNGWFALGEPAESGAPWLVSYAAS